MSASREKKARKELAVSGMPDPKKVRQEEERKKQHRSNMLYGIIAGVFVLAALYFLISSIWTHYVAPAKQSKTTAVTIDGVDYSAAEVDYYYHNLLNYWLNHQYASYMGISASTDRATTNMSDTAKMLTGVDNDPTWKDKENVTWDEYLKDASLKTLKQVSKLSAMATEAGYTFTDEMQAELDANLKTIKDTAKSYGVSFNTYLKYLFGSKITKDAYVKVNKEYAVANAFKDDHANALTYTESDLEAYYQEHKEELDVFSYESIFFNGVPATKKDADGKTIEATDEEKAAAKTAAKEAADAALERFKAGEDLETIAKDYDIATYSKQDKASHSHTNVGEWLSDEKRAEGDVDVVESDPSYYVVLFHSRSRTEDRTIDVRHILFLADTSSLNKDAETYEADVHAIKELAKAKAEDALKKWKDGDATQDSFAALAKELSEDPGSKDNGGLYEKVYPGQMVTAFNDWCFDESRKTGDTDVVETSYGYHVMYFVGDNVPYWQFVADSQLRDTDQNKWLEEQVANVTVTQEKGMEYVG
ncbi:MAG: peptidylprolyl isomerase [Oscillospiraceae bacterium]|nr:peptidylprolyl isomerase [Oscillospiraceae bacterium]